MEKIKGQLITLRPTTLLDRRQIFEWLTLSDLTSKMIGPPVFPDNEIPTWEYFVEDYNPHFFADENPDQGRSFVIENHELEPVGHINYNEINRLTNAVELDIWMASSRYCRKGYGTEAIGLLTNYLAGHLACRTFLLAPSERNKEAVKAYEKCGFQRSAEIPDYFVPDYYDTVVMIKKINEYEF